ncbi:hypothetical protein PCANC_25600 [Puccinia coronata f. sp. avenae]|uniref:Polar growth protein n=1 Tax=Puccinia coronata f. sp. avenae TaxID=200324 RepID=A0A2N5TCD4_9BASI|nr:hypothetical protein PCANC_25600 [Puccinia coronata f. sp. avenae]
MQKPKLIVYAIHDFQAENPDELSFSAGEAIEVTEKDDLYGDGWWQGRNTKGQFGLFPQAYTIPTTSVLPTQQATSKLSANNPQPTMHETLYEVQNAIDQLHHPSPSTTSLRPSSPNTPNTADQTPTKISEPDDDYEASQINLHSNPAQARALLAQKAQADSYNSHAKVMERLKSASHHFQPSHRASLNSLVSIPGIGDMELSEESESEEEQEQEERQYPSHHTQKTTNRSRSSTVAATDSRRPSKSNSTTTAQQRPTSPPSLHGPSAPNLSNQASSDSVRQTTSFKPGPFSAAAMALGLTGSPKDKEKEKEKHQSSSSSSFQKSHQPQKLSSSSILSDMGLDHLRDHINLTSAPVASTLRMSRESSQFTNLPTLSDLNHRNQTPVLPSTTAEARPPSPQEQLADTVALLTGNALATTSQDNLSANPPNSHTRETSACSIGSGIFLNQQLSQTSANHASQGNQTSVSTADSSSVKGSRSRSSSRAERYATVEDQPTSPATSTFPSSAGARQGDGSFSSSQSRKPMGAGSFASTLPDQWTVTEVSDWAKAKGLDEFTVGKFIEHEITGDVLLELDVNALKEIDLTAFGRRARVIKAIEELKKNQFAHKQSQPSPLSPLSNGVHHLPSSSIDSTLQPSALPNSRKESTHNHHQQQQGGVGSSTKQDYSTLFQKAYHPPMEVSDREEELAYPSPRDSATRISGILQSHTKRPSDASGGSSHRRQENVSSSEDLGGTLNNKPPGYKRTSSATGRPRQTTFSSNHDGSQTHHQRNQSKATNDTKGRSRASSWTPLTESPATELTDTIKDAAALEEPIVLDTAAEKTVEEKPKKGKKSKLGIQKASSTVVSGKNKKISLDSPDRRPATPDSPDKSRDAPSARSRTSFLGTLRVRKPPPKLNSQSPVSAGGSNHVNGEGEGRPGSSSGGVPSASVNGRTGRSLFSFGGHEKVQGQTQHQIQHLTPLAESTTTSKNSISSPLPLEHDKEKEEADLLLHPSAAAATVGGKKAAPETRTALERIGAPDHIGWMRKKGEKYPTWKLRYFILKGSNLYYLKAENEIRIKGLIKLAGFKVVMDADVHPGRYGFRIIHDNGATHLFSADDSKLLRDWMKAMMKATIDRDWVAPVISSCNIRTIPIREAQKMFPPPRPPSPLSRARVQKARMTANPDMLSEKDAAVLMGLPNLQHNIGASSSSPSSNNTPAVVNPDSPDERLRSRKSTHRPLPDDAHGEGSEEEELSTSEQELLDWMNEKIERRTSVVVRDFSRSIRNGLVLVRLIESLTGADSGLADRAFIPTHLLNDHALSHRGSIIQNDEDFDIFFSVFDFLNSQKIPLAGYSLNDLISGDPHKTREFLMRVYQKFEA